ncbi:MAG: FAD binding domain-containing protein [Chloroflexota bacterium]
MAKIKAYHRPETVDEAVRLLQREQTAVLAGGTSLVSSLDDSVEELVDLQAVGLNRVEVEGDTITIGAMVRLQMLVEHSSVPELVRQMARQEAPSTFRNAGTIGGTIAAADWESELYAALLVHEAVVTVQGVEGEKRFYLSERWNLLDGEVITAVSIKTTGQTASARVARTPADKPIVAVVGRRAGEELLLAVCGAEKRPILVDPAQIEQLTPPSDFRGSYHYRLQMAKVLMQRVIEEL